MKSINRLILSTSPPSQTVKKPYEIASLTRRQRPLYGRKQRHSTGKERDSETGLYYYGARYLDSRTGRWLSGDPAMGDYVPQTGGKSDNLPGMGGVYNTANLHVYHYSNNNPVKYVDPNGEVVNLAAAGIGAVIGAGVGAAFAIAGGGSTRDVVAAAAGGAVAGAMGGLTMGASVAVGMAGAGLASMAGYGTQQLVAGEAATPEGYAQSGFSGVAGYAAGQVIGKGITAISNKISSSQTTTGNVPSKFSDTLRTIRETGAAPEGFRGGKSYANDGRGGSQVLPNTDRSGKPITYREWDVNPSQRDVNRGAERIVTGSDGSAYYTTDHYKNLDPMQ